MPADPERTPKPRDGGELGGSVVVARGVTLPASVLRFSAVRASGPGGQNVNRRSTKVELRVFVDALPLDDWTRGRLRRLAGRKVNSEGELILVSQEGRTQLVNKRVCVQLLGELIQEARKRPTVRKATRPSRGARERRLDEKRRRGAIKDLRRSKRRPPDDL